jgi:hypothetical protein
MRSSKGNLRKSIEKYPVALMQKNWIAIQFLHNAAMFKKIKFILKGEKRAPSFLIWAAVLFRYYILGPVSTSCFICLIYGDQ